MPAPLLSNWHPVLYLGTFFLELATLVGRSKMPSQRSGPSAPRCQKCLRKNAPIGELKWQRFFSPVVLMTDCSTPVLILQRPTCPACQLFHPTARIPARGKIFDKCLSLFQQCSLYFCTNSSWQTPSYSSGRKTRPAGLSYWNSHGVFINIFNNICSGT